ncbi:MAG: FAD-binding oxidoreductase, partial [Rhodospirillales bacterium]|nr:FAD-binding oxidoreductase [Rhodospirillales bacterium]
MKCLVVGGGAIGTSIAWHLAERGLGEVVLLEQDRFGAGTTWHSAGNITWRPLPDQDAPVLYAFEAIDRLERDGLATGWLKTGRTFFAASEAFRNKLATFDAAARERGLPARFLDSKEATALNPLLDPSKIDAIWLNPLSGRVNPADLTAAYAAAARRAGATIREGVEVRSIATQGGRVTGVETNQGFIAGDTVVCAAGLWSRSLLRSVGVA